MITYTSEIKDYKKLGFTLLKSFYDKSVIKAAQNNCELILKSIYCNPNNIRSRYQYNSGNTPERFDPVIDIAPVLKALSEDSNLLEVISKCLKNNPKLFKDKLILKSKGTGGYPMHQDYAWWTSLCPDPNAILSIAIALDETTAGNGAVEVFSNPVKGLIAVARNMDSNEQAMVKKESLSKLMVMAPGDVLLMHSLAPHQSADNNSGSSRRMLYLTYNSDKYGDLRTSYYQYYINRERGDSKDNQRYFW